MQAVITGVAGFIGSTLAETLIRQGVEVIGIDSLDRYYSPRTKRENLQNILSSKNFTFLESDAAQTDPAVFMDADYIFHLAGQPGVRSSWGSDFPAYVVNNILLTQHILEIAKSSRSLKRFVFASSSSVYGDSAEHPLRESTVLRPVSPYGVTKLSAEQLCALYSEAHGIPVVCLRYFTVYGPRQRPDMAFHRFFRSALSGEEITIYGDGGQIRDFTYVGDIVRATIRSALAYLPERCTFMNIGSGRTVRLDAALELIGAITGQPLQIVRKPPQVGDMRITFADISKAQKFLAYAPAVSLSEGLRAEYDWFCRQMETVSL